nr:metallophosphoesterase [Bacteroidota bacterium]
MKNILYLSVLITSFFSCISCEKLFEYSPYQINIKEGFHNLHDKNLVKLRGIEKHAPDTFTFAIIADNHTWYDEYREVIDHINSNPEILFVLHAGDLTDYGLLKEYEWQQQILSSLKMPYFITIGNHDLLSNGEGIFRKMYGETDYSFTFKNHKFICLNTNIQEVNRDPDFDFLHSELKGRESYSYVFVLAHVAPTALRFSDENESRYRTILAENNVNVSMHGHSNHFSLEEIYNDGVLYLTTSSVKHLEYSLITIRPDTIIIKNISVGK